MFKDEFYYRPKLTSWLFKSPCMKFEGEGDGEGEYEGGGSGEVWQDKYETTKGNNVFARYNTEEEAHKAHLEARKTISSPYRLPKSLDVLTDEQKAEFTNGIATLRGVPDTADGYIINKPEDVPDEMKFNEEDEKAAKEIAKKHQLSNEAIQELADHQYNMVRRAYEAKAKANEEAAKKCVEQLKEAWKADYDENSILIERYLRGLVNPDWTTVSDDKDEKWQNFRTQIYDSQVGNNPIIMQGLLASAKQAVSEGKVLAGITAKGEKAATTDEELWKKNNPNSPYPGSAGS